jgi:hypothetical protein
MDAMWQLERATVRRAPGLAARAPRDTADDAGAAGALGKPCVVILALVPLAGTALGMWATRRS